MLHSVRPAFVLIALGLFIPLGFLPFAKGWDSRSSWIENIQDSAICFKGPPHAHVFTEAGFLPPQPSRRKPDVFDELVKEGIGRPASPPLIEEFDAIPDPSSTGAVRKAFVPPPPIADEAEGFAPRTKHPRYEDLVPPQREAPRLPFVVEKIVNGQIEIRDEYSQFVIHTDGTITEKFPLVRADGIDFIPDEMGTFALFYPETPAETRKVAVQSASLPEAPSGQRRIWQYGGFQPVKPGIFLPFSVVMLSGTIMAFAGTIILIFSFGRSNTVGKAQ